MSMDGVEPIWDGNGGSLDPKKAPQRDLLVALHVKVDSVIIPQLEALNEWRRDQENGDLTRGQKDAIREMFQKDDEAKNTRRQRWVPTLALAVSFLALIAACFYTAAALNGGTI